MHKLAEGISRDGVEVPELVRQIRAAVDQRDSDSVHAGATSQDIVDTARSVTFSRVFEIIDIRLSSLIAKLDDWQRREGDLPLMAHTRMQRALPFTAGAKLSTWIEPLRRHRMRLADVRTYSLTVQLGGPIGTGDSFKGHAPAIIAAMAKELGIAPAASWHSERDRVTEIGHILAQIAGSLGKMGQDIGMMSQNEVNEIALSGGGSSSAMAHKNNPVSAEVLVALARYTAGLQGTLLHSLVHEGERSGAAWTLEWMVLPSLAETTGAALRHATRLIDGARFVPMSAS